VITQNSAFDNFRQSLETLLHPNPHNNIGGDMSQMYSPNDPIFWSHHAFVDYIWAQWQASNGYGFGNDDGSIQALDLPYTISQVLDYRPLCYQYDDLSPQDLSSDNLPPPTITAPPSGALPPSVTITTIPTDNSVRFDPTDRTNLVALRLPRAIPDAFLTMNNIDVSSVRQLEAEYANVYTQLNAIKGYCSPCSLWKRPSLCQGLVGQVPQFCVDVQGVGRMQIGYSPSPPDQCMSNVQRSATYVSPNINLPPDTYRSQLQQLVGAAAFHGAASMNGLSSTGKSGSPSKVKAWMSAAVAMVAAVPLLAMS